MITALIAWFVYSMVSQYRVFGAIQRGFEESKIRLMEKERRLVAADLHDDVGPLLSIAKMKMGAVRPLSEKEKRFKLEACDHIEEIYRKIRQLSQDFSPVEMDDLGPLCLIDQFVQDHMKDLPLKIEVHPVICRGLSPGRSIQVYRILQEIIHNAVKHSKARELQIRGEINENILSIYTYDNGVGFREPVIGEPRGLGLQNLKMRAKLINGVLVQKSAPGSGTQYVVRVMMDKPKIIN
jgi:signal transduction histidine kinase